jgi:catechol 2,3-dioxygenase-like lactoylglutathione lyase family enzyme
MDRPVFDQVNLVVTDMAATLEFYELLGVTITPAPPPWDRHHRTFATGSAGDGVDVDVDSATFAAHWDQGWPAGRAGLVLGFRLPSRAAVDETYERLTAAGHAGQQPPYDAMWGARYAVVTDPDGNAVGLMCPTDPSRRSAPPDLGSDE